LTHATGRINFGVRVRVSVRFFFANEDLVSSSAGVLLSGRHGSQVTYDWMIKCVVRVSVRFRNRYFFAQLVFA